jgi:hypothetical protein
MGTETPMTKTTSKAKGPVKARQATTPQSPGTHGTASDIDARAAFDRFLPAAMHLPKSGLVGFRGDPEVALGNVKIGVASVLAEQARVKNELPAVNISDVASMPELALALSYANLQASVPQKSGGEIVREIRAAQALRHTLLSIADGLAAAGLVPKREVDAIRAGQGSIDTAKDCVALGDLFERHGKAIAGKHAATAQMLNGARRVGAYLLENLKPAQARKTLGKANAAEIEARDRLWTLLVQRHDVLRRIGFWLWGAEIDAHVPALLRQRAPSKGKGAKAAKKAAGAPAKPAALPVA